MNITEVRVFKAENPSNPNFKGLANVTIDDALVIHSIAIHEGQKGMYITMPARKSGDEYKDIVHPITSEFRNELQTAVLNAFEEA